MENSYLNEIPGITSSKSDSFQPAVFTASEDCVSTIPNSTTPKKYDLSSSGSEISFSSFYRRIPKYSAVHSNQPIQADSKIYSSSSSNLNLSNLYGSDDDFAEYLEGDEIENADEQGRDDIDIDSEIKFSLHFSEFSQPDVSSDPAQSVLLGNPKKNIPMSVLVLKDFSIDLIRCKLSSVDEFKNVEDQHISNAYL